ncbi:MAG: hypothetical protein V4620_12315 [Bacteroidota bacterium]
MILTIILIVFFLLAILMCWQESKKRKINFFVALFICVITTPLIGYFIISSFGLRNPRGCKWCGNEYNEAEYCGICKKNENGELKNEPAI